MELQLRVDKLENLYDDFNDIQLKIECLCDNIDAEALERTSIESQYYGLIAQAKIMISNHSKTEQEETKSNHSSYKRQLVKLPTIKLPKFSGSYDTWLEFHDTFSSLIHNNDEID